MNLYVLFCLVFSMPLYASVYMCFVVTCWERADNRVYRFPIGILGQVWYLIVSIPVFASLFTFTMCNSRLRTSFIL